MATSKGQHQVQRISNRQYINLIDGNYSVPLSEMLINDETRFVANALERDSSLTTEWLLNLVMNNSSIVQLPPDVEQVIRDGNSIKVQGSLHAISSSKINELFSPYLSGNSQSSKQGKAGNLSMTYFTPYVAEEIREKIKDLGLDYKFKVLSQQQIDIINKTEPVIIFGSDNDADGVYVVNLAKEVNKNPDVTLERLLNKGLKPIRIAFKNMSPDEAVLFNLKPLNSYLREQYRTSIEQSLTSVGKHVERLSSRQLKEKGINILSVLKNKISNNRFLCVLDKTSNVESIYAIKQKFVYFPAVTEGALYPITPESMAAKRIRLDSGVFQIKRVDPAGNEEQITINSLDLAELTTKKGLNQYVEIFKSNSKKIKEIMTKNVVSASIFPTNEEIQEIINTIHACADNVFLSLERKKISHTNLVDDCMIIKKVSQSNQVSVNMVDSNGVTHTNHKSDISLGTIHKENLDLNRSSLMVVGFVSNFADVLKDSGHSNISINMESSGAADGGYNVTISSTKAGNKYSQVYMLKSNTTWSRLDENFLSIACQKLSGTIEFDLSDLPYQSESKRVIGINLETYHLNNKKDFKEMFLNNIKPLKMKFMR